MRKVTLHNRGHKETCRKNKDSSGNSYTLIQGKWQAATLVSTLEASKKRTDSIRSNLHAGHYASSVTSGHSQGQVLVEPLALPVVTRHINKFLCKAT